MAKKQKDIQRYDNPFERNNPNQMAADEKIIQDAAQKYGVQDTGAGSNIRNELERMRNKNYQRANPEELKVANSMNLGQNNVGGNQYFTAQQPTFAEVRGDVRTRLGQDARNYGGGIKSAVSAMANAALPGQIFEMANAGLKSLNSLSGQIKPLYSGTIDLFKKGLGSLNAWQQQIFMNPEKYKFLQEDKDIQEANRLEADAKEIEATNKKVEENKKQLEDLLSISANMPGGTLNPFETPEIFRDQFTGTGQSYMDTKENFNSRIPSDNSIVFNRQKDMMKSSNPFEKDRNIEQFIPRNNQEIINNSEVFNRQKDMMKSSNPFEKDRNIEQFIPRNNQEIINNSDLIDQTFLDNILNTSGTGQSATDTKDNFNSRIPPGITSLVNDLDASNIVTEDDRNNTILDQINNFPKITPYNNPFNLEFRNQNKATPGYGGDDGQRFASFPDVNTGLKEGFDRVSEIVGDGRSTKSFLDIYAPRSDNEESYDNYLKELVKRVGYTIEPDEVKDLGETIIKQENTSKISDQYLDYLQTNANKVFNSGIVS